MLVVADSGFPAKQLFSEKSGFGSELLFSDSESTNSGFLHVYDVISRNLPLHHTRTFFNGSIGSQATKKENHITIVSTSALKIENKPQMQEDFPRLSYEKATSMYLNDSEAALRSLFSVPSTIEFGNKVELIKCLKG
jgi:hypothetical protein